MTQTSSSAAVPPLSELKFSDSSPVTVVLTSCGRPDLLIRTLDSFFKYNSFPLKKFIITEDSAIPNINKDIKKAYPNLTYIEGLTRVGQIESIDRAYKVVDTPYIFHLEEDWEFYKSGFIEESLEILRTRPMVSAVMCIAHGRYRPDPRKPRFCVCPKKGWGYYSFNPGLRRLSDYAIHCMGAFSKITTFHRNRPIKSEKAVNDWFRNKGMRMAVTTDPTGYVRHIGTGRHVNA